jgi:hypothetical protein
MIDLKAQVYEEQEKARQAHAQGRDDDSGKRKRERRQNRHHKNKRDPLAGGKNRGVEERSRLDEVAARTSHADSCSLEKKADLYNKLAVGLLEDRDETYDVDFVLKKAKRYHEATHGGVSNSANRMTTTTTNLSHHAAEEKEEALFGGGGMHATGGAASTSVLPGFCQSKASKASVIKAVASRTLLEREKVAEIKDKRQRVKEQKRLKLKAAYLAKLKLKEAKVPAAGKSNSK